MMKIKLTMQLMIEVAREEGYSADSDQVDETQTCWSNPNARQVKCRSFSGKLFDKGIAE